MNRNDLEIHIASEMDKRYLVMTSVAFDRFVRDVLRVPLGISKLGSYLDWIGQQSDHEINTWCLTYLGENYDRKHFPEVHEWQHGEG